MYLFQLFRSFLPLRNPIGFGASDFVELALAILLLLFVLARPWVEPYFRKLAERTGWCLLLFAVLPVAFRLLLLPHSPVPTPSGSDDFSYILLGDTLAHFRLANPPHALNQFLEAIFVLQEPTYSSIYPLGQGIALALGRLVFGCFWAGVVLSVALLCSLCYWMLRGWTTPFWAFVGGLLAVMEFGPLNQWMNTYWGGAVSAVGGCLVFGALPRLRRGASKRNAALLGLGAGLQLLTRPFEFVLLVIAVALFFLPALRRSIEWRAVTKTMGVAVLVFLPAVALTFGQNEAVTGSWTTLPYMLSRYQYGVPTTFTVQPNPVAHRQLTPEQDLDYRAQAAIHGPGTDTMGSFFARLGFRARYYRFFFFAPLYIALAVFLATIREFRYVWVVLTLLIFSIGTNFYPYFYPQYIAAETCLFVLAGLVGLERLSLLRIREWRIGTQMSWLILLFCAVQFVFWYSLHVAGNEDLAEVFQYETSDFINSGDPEGRIAVNEQLAHTHGKQLVFVRYAEEHGFHEWIHNRADIDAARVVWASDLGDDEDKKLLRYYPDRQVWLLEPDADPPILTRYHSAPGAFEGVQ